ncbi:MAG: 8-oxoguanine deaminase, partial [Niameybacter sp.]
MYRLLIKNIQSLITCDPQDTVLHDVHLYCVDGVIKSIGPDTFEADQVIDGKNMLVYPGLINTHHHLYQTFTRNLPEVQNMELFDWLTTLYELWKGITPDVIKYSS